jgi:hypothetical protein
LHVVNVNFPTFHLLNHPTTHAPMKPTSIRLTKVEATFYGKHIPVDALARHCPLDKGCHLDLNTTPAPGLLSQLPIELQHQVLLSLDFKSLMNFR